MEVGLKSVLISPDKMRSEFLRILLKIGFTVDRAEKCAEIFMNNSLEGVYSHGVNRFPRFVKNIQDGYVNPVAEPILVHKTGSIEQWNGNLGPGPLNAFFATERAMNIARENGIGLLAMANTNHWMRAGAYGWHAARKGFVFICWTNTCPNMPAWGAKDTRLGNNPFVIAVPYGNKAIVLDFAMSLFSYGKMELYKSEGKKLPYHGGFDRQGELTTDPAEILETWRPLPIGYWKGAGFSLLLDILATILSGGQSTHEVKSCISENAVSQVFIAINLSSLHNFPSIDKSIHEIIEDLKGSVPVDGNTKIRYPGESMLKTREENLKYGIPVNSDLWTKICCL
jgi:3-dehydro-L-gulonate 2-dehydrogenase